jgi:hypothetical protein
VTSSSKTAVRQFFAVPTASGRHLRAPSSSMSAPVGHRRRSRRSNSCLTSRCASHNTERDLSVSARHSGLSLSWQGIGNSPAETASSLGWFRATPARSS